MLPKISLTHYRHFQGFVSVLYWKTSCRTEKFWGRHSLFFKNCIIKRHFAAESAAENNVNFKSNSPFSVQIPQNSSYVLDSELADQIVTALRKNQADPNVPVLESNPGIGLVTRKLVQAGVKRVLAVEAIEEFLPSMLKLQGELDHKVLTVFHWDYTLVWLRVVEANSIYQQHEDAVIAYIPPKKSSDGPPLTVFTVLPENKEAMFLLYLIMSFSGQSGFFTLGHPEWFLVISPTLYRKLLLCKMEKDRPLAHYSPFAMCLEVLFDIHLCSELPGWKFTPNFKTKKFKDENLVAGVSSDMRYLIRLTPHSNVYDIIALSEVETFLNFLRQMMSKRTQRLIIRMEELVPNCGIRLIAAGHTMIEQTGDLSPYNFLQIFKEMKTWPEYDGSPMKHHLFDSAGHLFDDDPDLKS
ncbi:uncharacterized protein LOC112570809 [Pomacea canaliculata]|uniref:uncharacterized protein LOC112570809 n=1 Tax=Pomacea canaliculata TaxID=400727 RepID=UPI000D733181|nr:uncharacterized protein LOC112570809 [Pomacea canaliculata]XP_025105225.1 uncharacterized protein LOC112570809 [Pomacea canaliculata]